ncbi:glycosyltransferase family 10 domain-containing protein [Arcticibacter sp.]|jgi:hypothetical protein|uniref:glycosyltransferase family 10 domain-containing protein n=1 Tax=Arcticibacter sp. TaxID=1872630 RepID=UPI00388FE786
MIKVCWITKGPSNYLTDEFSVSYLKSKDIGYTNNLLAADILLAPSQLSRRFKLLHSLLFFKKKIVWTNEPAFDRTFENFRSKGKTVMNAYSGNVFMHNLHFLGSYHYDFDNDLGINLHDPPSKLMTINDLKKKNQKCLCVYGYRNPEEASIIYQEGEISLNEARQDAAQFLYDKGMADIMGKGWPKGIQIIEQSGYDSGENKWWIRKIDMLKKYKFNICLENTAFPYYCTEKIWHAIAGECLPVYSSAGNAIYDTFPKNSFVDMSEFASLEQLYNFLKDMPDEEYVERYNKCLQVLRESCRNRVQNPNMKTDILENFVQEVRALAGKADPLPNGNRQMRLHSDIGT